MKKQEMTRRACNLTVIMLEEWINSGKWREYAFSDDQESILRAGFQDVIDELTHRGLSDFLGQSKKDRFFWRMRYFMRAITGNVNF